MNTRIPNIVLFDRLSGLTFVPQIHVIYDDEEVPEILKENAVLEVHLNAEGDLQSITPGNNDVYIESSQELRPSEDVMNILVQGSFPARNSLPDLVDKRLPIVFEELWSRFHQRLFISTC
eukprot:TRINITY_DN535_c0_g1_i1.p1 TRINITY_DN535_c0_g1~~TRINITY_DN535_c0_g1_i1.p1  ORF type:complete len:120 (-),score=27.71 TRINITY_DN535_c0_g1_i1:241-600(-)